MSELRRDRIEGSTDEGLSRGVADDRLVDLADRHVVTTDLEVQARTRVDPTPARFDVRRADDPLGVVLALGGELDLATAPVLQEQLDRAMRGGATVVIDLSGLRFIDSSGLHMLLRAERQLRDSGGPLVLVRGPRAVHRPFELTSLDAHFEFCDFPSAALRTAAVRRIESRRIPKPARTGQTRPSSTATPVRSDVVMNTAAVGRERAIRELFDRWQRDKDPRARECLVERYLPLARKLAARYRGRAGEPFDDLLQVASLGLLKALDRFDPDRGTAFSSFAVPTILGELKRYFRDTGWSAHVPRAAQELALKVQEAEQAVGLRLGRSPTADELAQYMEATVEQVIDGLEAAAAHHAASLEKPHDELDGESRSLCDVLGEDDPGFEQIDASLTIRSAARRLSEREQRVLQLRFQDELTQSEIAERIGVSQMQVSRILRGAVERMREDALTEDRATQPAQSAETTG